MWDRQDTNSQPWWLRKIRIPRRSADVISFYHQRESPRKLLEWEQRSRLREGAQNCVCLFRRLYGLTVCVSLAELLDLKLASPV